MMSPSQLLLSYVVLYSRDFVNSKTMRHQREYALKIVKHKSKSFIWSLQILDSPCPGDRADHQFSGLPALIDYTDFLPSLSFRWNINISNTWESRENFLFHDFSSSTTYIYIVYVQMTIFWHSSLSEILCCFTEEKQVIYYLHF